jgi:ATP-binding cassette subfamily F protein 3
VIQLSSLSKSFGDRVLLDAVTWQIDDRERVGLSGPNGAGKTTLLKMLADLEESDGGTIVRPTGLTIGYLPQDGLVHSGRTLRDEASLAFKPLLDMKAEIASLEDRLGGDHLSHDEHEVMLSRYSELQDGFRRGEGYTIELKVTTVLRGLGFSDDDLEKKTETFSGGWQMRIALAKLLLEKPDLLLLDEPTNHLDIEMREALTEALLEFEGALVVIAHDRHLLRATVDELWLVANGGLAPFDGDLDDYRDWVLARRRMEGSGAEPPAELAAPPVDRKAQKRTEAEARQRLAEARRPLEKRIAAIERELKPLQLEKTELEAWLASTVAYDEDNKGQLQERVKRQGEIATRIATLEEDWLWVNAEFDAQR